MELTSKSTHLENSYCNELIKAGVDPNRAAQAARRMTEQELMIIGEIWGQWGSVLNQSRMMAS